MPLPRPAFRLFQALLLLGSLCAALAGFTQATGTASSPVSLEFNPYIHRLNGPAADPVNLIFYGADANAVAAAVHRVLGWTAVEGSPMTFTDEGVTRPMRWQFGQQLSRSARLHVRIEDLRATDSQDYVLAAVHRDDTAPCGHVGGAFDRERERVAKAFGAAGYAVTPVWLGNTAPGPQCDGSFTAGDGNAVVIDLTTTSGS